MRSIFMFMVLLLHVQLLGAGWIGVPLFFVLSGYLITRVLLKGQALAPNSRSLFFRFYARRSLRIFPIYFLYLGGVALAALATDRWDNSSTQLVASSLYLSNFFALTNEYVTGSWHAHLLDHTWSLSVEEQFYLLWPLVIAWIPRARLLSVLYLMVIAAVGFRALIWVLWPQASNLLDSPQPFTGAIHVLMPSYLDAFAIGALLNFLRWSPTLRQVILLMGLTLIAGAINGEFLQAGELNKWLKLTLGFPPHMQANGQFLWGYTLIAVNGAALIACARSPGLLQRWLSHRWLCWVGERSYGAYLYHVPIVMMMWPFVRELTEVIGSKTVAVLLFLPLIIAVLLLVCGLSYRYIEKPILNYKNQNYTS